LTAFFERVNSLAPHRVRQAHPEVRRFIKFAIVGAVGMVVDYTILIILVFGFHVPDYSANIFSVTAAILSNFTWNTLWTFPESRSHTLHKHFVQFVMVNVAGLGINELVFVAADHLLFEPLLIQYGFDKALAIFPSKALAIGIVLFWNFGINRIWTYRHVEFGSDSRKK
jgi:putative flippase GtrA